MRICVESRKKVVEMLQTEDVFNLRQFTGDIPSYSSLIHAPL